MNETSPTTRRRSKMIVAVYILAALAVLAVVSLYAISLTAGRPDDLGVQNGRLAQVPDKPNAVSTQTDQEAAAIAPIDVPPDLEAVIQQVADIVTQMDGSTIVTQDETYLYAEFRSKLFRFVDDVEFYFDADERQLHFRSASRVGHSDLGANRNRMEEFRRRFQQRLADPS